MGSFGGFYKGDKKKKKKSAGQAQGASSVSNKPVFVMPKVIEKKKKWE